MSFHEMLGNNDVMYSFPEHTEDVLSTSFVVVNDGIIGCRVIWLEVMIGKCSGGMNMLFYKPPDHQTHFCSGRRESILRT